MSSPLWHGDPPHLGSFRMQGRLSASAAGIVYLGRDSNGRQASVALLTRGAASDPAARDRFRAAIRSEMGGAGVDTAGATGAADAGVPRGDAGRETGAGAATSDAMQRGGEVLAADPDSAAPWVATAYDPARPGAERFLDPVAVSGGGGTGPDFLPYWLGADDPAKPPPPGPAGPAVPGSEPRPTKGLFAIIITLIVALLVAALLLFVLFACQPGQPEPSEPSPSPASPTETSPSPSPTPTPTSPSPSPSPSPTDGSPTPAPTGDEPQSPGDIA